MCKCFKYLCTRIWKHIGQIRNQEQRCSRCVRGRKREGATVAKLNFELSKNFRKFFCQKTFLSLQKCKNLGLKAPRNWAAKLKFWALIISSVGKLQLSVKISSEISSVCLKIATSCPAYFLRATAAAAVARLSHRSSVCPSVCPFVCPSVTRADQSKTVQTRITKSSPLAVRKALVSGTIKLFYKFEGGHPERGR